MNTADKARWAIADIYCGRWCYCVGIQPLVDYRLQAFRCHEQRSEADLLQVGPLSFSVTYEINRPPAETVLREVKPEPADELQLRGLKVQ
jgi:hypothetical protein